MTSSGSFADTTNRDRSRSGSDYYGLDLYSLIGSVRAVLGYLDRVDPEAAEVARERYGCLAPWSRRARRPTAGCRCREATRLCEARGRPGPRESCSSASCELRRRATARPSWTRPQCTSGGSRRAGPIARCMYGGLCTAWNLRDRHMFETLCAFCSGRGPDTRAVVSGPQLPCRRCPLHRHGHGARRVQPRPAVRASGMARDGPDRVRHACRLGRRRRRLGRPDGGQGGSTRRRADIVRALCPSTGGARAVHARPARGAATACAGAAWLDPA